MDTSSQESDSYDPQLSFPPFLFSQGIFRTLLFIVNNNVIINMAVLSDACQGGFV